MSASTKRRRLPGFGITLDAHVWEPEGEAKGLVLLVHGFADAGGTWQPVAPALVDAGLRVVAPDMRGFGQSDRVGAGGYYHFPDYVADLDAVSAELSPDAPFALVGHSMGGTVATLFAGARPERVDKLVLLEGIGPPTHAFSDAPTRMRTWLGGIERFRGTSNDARRGRVMETEALALKRLGIAHPGVGEATLRARLQHLLMPTDGGFVWTFDAMHRTTSPFPFYAEAFCEFAAQITCPVLYVDGGETGFHPPDEAARLAAFADVRHETIEGAGHMMHWTEPAKLARLLVAALAE